LKEKQQGYHYRHSYSHDFVVMQGYHYLMHIGRMLNEIAFYSISLTEHVKTVGFQDFICIFKAAMPYSQLNKERLKKIAESAGQLRLVLEDDWRTKKPAV